MKKQGEIPRDFLDAAGSIGAPAIRVARGDVVEEPRVELSTSGRVLAARRGHRAGQLARLAAHGLARELVEAGERLALDFERSTNGQRVVMPLDGDRVDGGGGLTQRGHEQMLASVYAHRRVSSAIEAIGPELGHCVVAVVIGNLAPTAWARTQGMPEKAGVTVLTLGLRALVRYYGGTRK